MPAFRYRNMRFLLAMACLPVCAYVTVGCMPHSKEEYTLANQTTYDPWITGEQRSVVGPVEPNPSTGAGSYRSIDARNGVSYP